MRLYVDLDSERLVRLPGYSREVDNLSARRGDQALVEVQFVQDGYVVDPGTPSAMALTIKTYGSFSENPALARTTTFVKTGTGTSTKWSGVISLNTDGIATLVGDAATGSAMIELSWTLSGYVQSAKWVPLTVNNAVERSGDTTPGPAGTSGVDPTITSQADLATVTTSNLTVPIIKLFVDTGTMTLQTWLLLSSTAATESGSVQRPSDYAAGTNEKVWFRAG